MTTSLARQLQQLAAPHTQVIFGEDKQKLSLLFDPKDAATVDKDTFYAMGVNGLEELESIDPSFQDFQESLFSEKSVNFERSVQTKEVNDKLNVVISKFLFRVSPYFLLKPAQKAMEWLVQRYHIHFYNIDDLLISILPYHDTNIFVRAVQLVDFNNQEIKHWSWLQPIQKAGVHVARSTLISHCGKNPAFFAIICDMVPKFIKAHEDVADTSSMQFLKTVFSFYTMTIISVLEEFAVTEKLLTSLFEPIGKGLQSGIAAYQASAYMIMSQLCSKVKLRENIAQTFVEIICKYINPHLATEAVTCLLVVFQTQRLNKLGKRNFKQLTRQPSLSSVLLRLSEKYNVQPLVKPLMEYLVPAAFKQSSLNILTSDSSDSEGPPPGLMSLLQELLTSVSLEESTALLVSKSVLRNFLAYLLQDLDHQELHHSTVRGIVKQLEGKYPSALDVAVDDMMLSVHSEKEKSAITSFLNLSAMSTKHQILPNSSSLVLCLNHRQASVRRSAIKYMLDHMSELEDASFISEAVLTRLQDDNMEIVKMLLQHSELPDLVENKEELQRTLLSLLCNSTSLPMSKMILKHMCEDVSLMEELGLTLVLPHLFLVTGPAAILDLVQQIFSSSLVEKSEIMQLLKTDWLPAFSKAAAAKTAADLPTLNNKLVCCLARAMLTTHGAESGKKFNVLFDQLSSAPRPYIFTCVVLLSMSEAVSQVTDEREAVHMKLELCRVIQKVYEGKLVSSVATISPSSKRSRKAVFERCASSFKKESKIPPETILFIVEKLVKSLSVPEKLLGCDIWHYAGDGSMEDEWIRMTIYVFNFLLDLVSDWKMTNQWKSVVALFVKSVFPGQKEFLRFLCLLWTQHVDPYSKQLGLSAASQARALCLGQMHLANMEPKLAVDVVEHPTPVLTSLLVVMSSPHERLRDLAMNSFEVIHGHCEKGSTLYKPLLEVLIKRKEELKNDSSFISQVFVDVVKQTDQPKRKSSPRRRRTCSSSAGTGLMDSFLGMIASESFPVWMARPLLLMTENINSVEIMTQLLPLLDRLLQLPESQFGSVELNCVELLLQRYTVETVAAVHKDSFPLKTLIHAIQSKHHPVESRSSVAEMAIDQVTREFYAGLSSDQEQQTILTSLFTSWVHTTNISVSNCIRKTVKKTLHLNANNVIAELQPVLTTGQSATIRQAKRQKKQPADDVSSTDNTFERSEWQRVVIVLEAVQDKKKLDNRAKLIPVCFQVLARVLELEENNNGEYIKQLLLTTIYNLCNRLNTESDEGGSIPEEHFSMELIVQCIRTSDNPQTHHQALLVLTVSAKICPEHLLHNIMTVFTFMGTNILRQDDSYSFHVISKILENVIPALITTCEEESPRTTSVTSKPEDVITMVMRVFVDAYPYIPQHRKLMLYTKLLGIVGEKEYLWRYLLVFTEHIVTRERSASGSDDAHPALEEKTTGPISQADLEFILSLMSSFTPSTQLKAARDAIMYLAQLPDDKDDSVIKTKQVPQSLGSLKKEESDIFSTQFHTAKQLRHFKYAGLHLFVSLLSYQEFVSQVSNKAKKKSLMKSFESVLETLLQYIGQISRSVEQHHNTPTSKYWKAYQHKAYELLEKIATLLPDSMFLEAVSGLLNHSLLSVQRKAMELLSNRLQQVRDVADQHQESLLLSLVEKLSSIVKEMDKHVEETLVNAQTALYSLKVMCRLLGARHPQQFIKVLKLISSVLKKCEGNVNVLACALLCVGEICADVKVHVIPLLPTFMPKLVRILKMTDELSSNELLLLSCVTAVHKVVENLPHFLSPYMLDITRQFCLLSGNDFPQKPAVQQRLQAIKHTMATVLPTRVMLPTVVSCYDDLVEEHQDSVVCLMSLLEDHIQGMDKEDLSSFHNEILNFFFTCLDFRVNFSQVAQERVCVVEDAVISTVISLVMKMSESTFRPMLYKIFDWATSQDETRGRVLVFYRLADRLAERLKSLFCLFAGYIVKHAAQVLDQNNVSKTDEKYFGKGKRSRKMSFELLDAVLDCLYKCFLHDSDGFVTVERFDTMMQSIVDQIDNTLGGDELYQTRVVKHLVPCIGQFAVAARDDSLWKAMNYQILLKTRNPTPEVKLTALSVIQEFHQKLGDDFMPLLPETIPFLAELMEDENEDVEKRCQAVIAEMERTLGEPLQKYF